MNIVYKLIFSARVSAGTKPYYYIGSKTNCTVDEDTGIILNNRGKAYYGSARYNGYAQIVKDNLGKIQVVVLEQDIDILALYEVERNYQIINDVVRSTEYFNLSYAIDNSFSMPAYGTYKNVHDENKCIRLPIDDELVVSGEYVGVSKGGVWINNGTETKFIKDGSIIPDGWARGWDLEMATKISRGEANGFFGHTHSEHTKTEFSKKAKAAFKDQEYRARYKECWESTKELMRTLIWVNNGIHSMRVKPNAIPFGYSLGRIKFTDEAKHNIAAATKRRFEGDAGEQYRKQLSESIKRRFEGDAGKVRKTTQSKKLKEKYKHLSVEERAAMFGKSTKGKVRITNGTLNKYIDKGSPLPPGYKFGVTRVNTKKEDNESN